MQELLKQVKRNSLISAGIFCLAGLLCIIFPNITINVVCILFSVAFGAVGVGNIIRYLRNIRNKDYFGNELAIGVIIVLVAIFFFWKRTQILTMIPMFLGFILIVNGVVKGQTALNIYRMKALGFECIALTAVLMFVFGCVLLFAPMENTTLIVALGVGMVIAGITDGLTVLFVSKDIKSMVRKQSQNVAAKRKVTEKTSTRAAVKEAFGTPEEQKNDSIK